MSGRAVLLLLASLAGCAVTPPLTTLRTLRVEASADANSLSATQLDLVFVFAPATDAALPERADAWFANRQALRAGHPTMLVIALQVPAAYDGVDIALPTGYRKAIGVYAYASYLAPAGLARCALTPLVHAALRLQSANLECAGK